MWVEAVWPPEESDALEPTSAAHVLVVVAVDDDVDEQIEEQ